MKTLKVKIEGVAPLLMHNGDLANPLNPYVKEAKKYSGKRKKTDEDHKKLHDIEWLGGLYLTEDETIEIPAYVLRAMTINGAKRDKNGKAFTSAIFVTKNGKFNHNGPKKIKDLQSDLAFRDVRIVNIQKNKIVRCRPKFDTWSVEFELEYDEDQVNKDAVVAALNAGGLLHGIGDARSLGFGRFKVIKVL